MTGEASEGARVVVVDDSPQWAECVLAFLSHKGLKAVGAAHSIQEALELIEEAKPDLVILDVRLVDCDPHCYAGLDAIPAILKLAPSTRIIVCTAFLDNIACSDAFAYGAWGFVLKQYGADDLISAVRQVQQGHKYVSSREFDKEAEIAGPNLTAIERHILTLLGKGTDTDMVAAELGVSEEVAAGQIRRLSAKLAKDDREGLVQFAKELARAKKV